MEISPKCRRAALRAAIRRYPECELAIRRLTETDENFRDICEEFVSAEEALLKVSDLPDPSRQIRRAEWQDTVDRLAREMKLILEGRDALSLSRLARR